MHNIVIDDPSLTNNNREIADIISISYEQGPHILYEELRMKKMFGN